MNPVKVRSRCSRLSTWTLTCFPDDDQFEEEIKEQEVDEVRLSLLARLSLLTCCMLAVSSLR